MKREITGGLVLVAIHKQVEELPGCRCFALNAGGILHTLCHRSHLGLPDDFDHLLSPRVL